MALIPTVPLWFDQTTAEAWQDKTDCKCFYPLTNVSIASKYQEYIFAFLKGCLYVLVLRHHVHHPHPSHHPHLGGDGTPLCHRN